MDFNSWLNGFLEGKGTLNKDEIELIKKKASETFVSYPSIPLIPADPTPNWPNPNSPNIWYSDGTAGKPQ